MKTKILMFIISFIFFALLYSIHIYAITNETEIPKEEIEDIQQDEMTNERIENQICEVQNQIQEEEKIEESILIPQESEMVGVTYYGTMNLEAPTYDKKFVQPIDNKIKIEGWAVSNDDLARVRILVDGNVVVNHATRMPRGDVDTLVSPNYGGADLTPKAGFETELEIIGFAQGRHFIRVEEVSRQGQCIASYETWIYIEKQAVIGHMYLDCPSYGKTFTESMDDKIKIEGWAVASDRNATIRVLIDGNLVSMPITRTKRGDVDIAISPNYGGIATTPMAGFEAEWQIAALAEGTHLIRIEQVTSEGICITSFESMIHIIKQEWKGNIFLDGPAYDKIFTIPNDEKIKVEGWAVSNDKHARVRILVDGNLVVNQAVRTKREDVDTLVSPSYGGTALTPNAGFEEEIDSMNLAEGRHQIRVEEITSNGKCIASCESYFQIKNNLYEGTMYLECPVYHETFIRPTKEKIKIEGWAVSNDKEATIKVWLDGVLIEENIGRVKREDVDQVISPQYGGSAITPKAGFVMQLPINELTKGMHQVRVEEISRYGQCISFYETLINVENYRYQGTMYLETPVYQQSFTKSYDHEMRIEGWAVSNDSGASLRILWNDNVIVNQVKRNPREDVDQFISPGYGGILNTPQAGFSQIIDMSNFETGYHKVRVEEISRYGDVISSYEIQVQIQNKKYLGEMCLDAPTVNYVYTIGEKIAVDGWAVSQDEQAVVEIYVDDVFETKAERYNRGDVVFYMNKYDGKTVNAGFGKLISSSEMTPGAHKITVYEKSRHGDVIGGVQVQILIKAPTNHPSSSNTQSESTNHNTSYTPPTTLTSGTKGIDVSQFQGNIDWKKVADSGIQYAMIRIGYRGYGTGGFAEDSRFKTNFRNAVANGLKVGVYFYSTAINTTEAQKDAEYVQSILQKYGFQNKVSMPIAIDLELVSGVNTRDKNVSKSMRTNIANTFCNKIAEFGYTPMVYACKSFLNDHMNANQIAYDVWVAQYNSKCTYSGKYTMWQYTSTGKVPGINGNVDCNLCYKNY